MQGEHPMPEPTAPRAISLSDEALLMIMSAAEPLQRIDRGRFLEAVADRLRGVADPGDGLVSRVCRELQPQFFRAPLEVDISDHREPPHHQGVPKQHRRALRSW
jgi:hypothetical protein